MRTQLDTLQHQVEPVPKEFRITVTFGDLEDHSLTLENLKHRFVAAIKDLKEKSQSSLGDYYFNDSWKSVVACVHQEQVDEVMEIMNLSEEERLKIKELTDPDNIEVAFLLFDTYESLKTLTQTNATTLKHFRLEDTTKHILQLFEPVRREMIVKLINILFIDHSQGTRQELVEKYATEEFKQKFSDQKEKKNRDQVVTIAPDLNEQPKVVISSKVAALIEEVNNLNFTDMSSQNSEKIKTTFNSIKEILTSQDLNNVDIKELQLLIGQFDRIIDLFSLDFRIEINELGQAVKTLLNKGIALSSDLGKLRLSNLSLSSNTKEAEEEQMTYCTQLVQLHNPNNTADVLSLLTELQTFAFSSKVKMQALDLLTDIKLASLKK